MIHLTSRQHPTVARFREAARRAVPDLPLLLDGPHLVCDAADATLRLQVIATTPAARNHQDVADALARASDLADTVVSVSDAVMAALSPVQTPSGIVALADAPVGTVDQVFRQHPALVVGAVGVQDPGNVGALIRAADAAGATGVLTSHGSADPFGWKALRGAMGSTFRLPTVARLAPESIVAAARTRGVRIVATSPTAVLSLYDADLTGPTLVLIGAEGPGLPPECLADADLRVRIPMAPGVESLNVAVAAGILLFEAHRQRVVNGHRTAP